jgi:osmotically-inducible protein OsmY
MNATNTIRPVRWTSILAQSIVVTVSFLYSTEDLRADKPSAPRPASADSFADCRHTIFARQAMQNDLLLAPLNVGVTVQGRTATLWGGIPSADLARRAEEIVRKVPGVSIVRNDLRVDRPGQLDGGLLVHSLSPTNTEPRPVVKPVASDSLTSLATWTGAEKTPPAPPIVVSLRAPIPREPDAGRPQANSSELTTAIIKLRDADPRFRQLRPEVLGGVVRLRGAVQRLEHAFEFAQTTAKLAGVERVIVEQITTTKLAPLNLP